jgi:signal transduction histidine kinase
VRFEELVQDSFADAQVLAQRAGLAVTLARCDAVVVRGDRHRLRQMLLNLTDNAIKYNRFQGSVDMSLARYEDCVELRITNTGPGIPPEQLPRVFDRFFRGDPAHGSEVEGCGLGLAITQWIVKAHRGEIQIASAANRETTVTVRLPLADARLPVEPTRS